MTLIHNVANGNTNESANGHPNGNTNGHANGHTNGHANGHTNGSANGSVNGKTNGENNGSTNGKVARPSIQPSVEVAISPNDASRVPDTIATIQSLGKNFSPSDNASRQSLLAEARRLVQALETPRETMIKHNWAQVSPHLPQQKTAADNCSPPHTWLLPLESTLGCSERCWRETLARKA